ncbi:hypothetical protein PTTG_25744 [Puccinia triticina 1-1 BBBD Race 1]|uniref:NAM-associated domain-containing protein n=1 Tax=Puccinia triticina (isolate 1-1 / race 1 (BBBD)) TaxID=630390 RepID=A0A180H1R4_PUCT1|nr:hypothetical protein PTTG_25744 [Puccinia triticina 1-1 BBBD Race 1]
MPPKTLANQPALLPPTPQAKKNTTRVQALEINDMDGTPQPTKKTAQPAKKPRSPRKLNVVQKAPWRFGPERCWDGERGEEDAQICRSWLEITEDPLNSTNQTANTFWQRVSLHYKSMITEPVWNYSRGRIELGREMDSNTSNNERPISSLKTRWQLIQRNVNKFYGCFQQVQRANQSGTTTEDRLTGALKLYAATEKSSFTHLQCYHILVTSPKWRAYCEELEQKKTQSLKKSLKTPTALSASAPTPGEQSSEITSSDAIDDNDTAPPPSTKPQRPIGNRKAKDIKNDEERNMKLKEDMLKVQRELAARAIVQNKILSAQRDAMTDAADESIMKVDLSTIRAREEKERQKEIKKEKEKEKEKEKDGDVGKEQQKANTRGTQKSQSKSRQIIVDVEEELVAEEELVVKDESGEEEDESKEEDGCGEQDGSDDDDAYENEDA